MNRTASPHVLPRVSVIIPTFNSGATLEACLQSILAQSVPRDHYEIIIADGGSVDDSRAIAARLGVDRIVENPLRTGEAGKSAGIREARGAFIALIDSDNLLDSPDWLTRMVHPLETDSTLAAAEPIAFTCRPQDPPLTRYFALLGMNDPLCLAVGNYDRLCGITGRWTDLPVPTRDCGDYLEATLSPTALPTIGANGFVFRRTLLDKVAWSPYFFDLDIMHQAVLAGFNRVAKVKCGIVHLYCARLGDFVRKQDRRIRDFLFFSKTLGRTYPWHHQQTRPVIVFCLQSVTLIPLLIQMIRGWRHHPDRAWLYHLPACWITLWIYGWAVIRKSLGFKPHPKSRDRWNR